MAAKKKTVATKTSAKQDVAITEGMVPQVGAARAEPVVETRHSAVPPKAAARVVTEDDIRTRAYFISISGEGGSEFDNWVRAESELHN